MILKPMNVGEILDSTFKLFKEKFKSYLGITLLGVGAATIINILMQISFSYQSGVVFFGLIFGLISMSISFAMTAGLVKKASEQIMGRDISINEAYRFGLGKIWPMFLASLLYGIAVTLGLILLIIPGIFLSISFCLFFYAIVVEGTGPWNALKRSKKLIKGSWWRTFGIVLIILIFVGILQ